LHLKLIWGILIGLTQDFIQTIKESSKDSIRIIIWCTIRELVSMLIWSKQKDNMDKHIIVWTTSLASIRLIQTAQTALMAPSTMLVLLGRINLWKTMMNTIECIQLLVQWVQILVIRVLGDLEQENKWSNNNNSRCKASFSKKKLLIRKISIYNSKNKRKRRGDLTINY